MTTGTFADRNGRVLTVDCHRCLSHYRVRNANRLKCSARSTCPACGTGFAVAWLVPSHEEDPICIPSTLPPSDSAGPAIDCSSTERCSFHAVGGSLFGMQISNACLSILTLGIYHFWGKARIRRYLFSQTEFAGDRFTYHGTGKELCQGFLKAMLVFGIPYFSLVAARTLLSLPSGIDLLLQGMAALVLFLYVPIAGVNARRYRFTRTSWRGIRFSFRGRTWEFLRLSFRGWIFTVLSLGTYYPYFQTQRQAFLHSHTYFGNQRFRFTGHGSSLMLPFAGALVMTYAVLGLCGLAIASHLINAGLTLLLIPLLLGPMWIWLMGWKQKYFWDHTRLGEAHFSSSITWQGLFTLYLGNLGLLIATVGCAWPWIMVRNARFQTDTLSLQGAANLDLVLQETTGSSVTGEGLSNFFDSGLNMD